MEGELSKLQAELGRAKQSLAEVIDECVFVERQRSLTDERLSAEIKERDRLLVNLLSSLRSLAEYLSILEERIIVPAIGSFNAAVKQFIELGSNRSSTIEGLEATLRAHDAMHLLSNFEPLKEEYEKNIGKVLQNSETTFSLNDVYILIRSLLDEKYRMRDTIDKVLLGLPKPTESLLRSGSVSQSDETKELRQKVLALTQELQKREEKQSSPQRLTSIPTTIDGENFTADDIQRLKDTIERQTRTVESCRASNSLPQLQSDARRISSEEGWSPKLKASEVTIDVLNKEVAQWEEKYRTLETRCANERAGLLAELAEERKKKRDDQEECDAVLERMTVELENLVLENAQLKKRIRMKGV